MGFESYMNGQLEQSEKVLKLYNDKIEKGRKTYWMYAAGALLINLISLLVIKFMSYKKVDMSFFDLFEETLESLDGPKFVYALYWIALAAVVGVTVWCYKTKTTGDGWIVPQLACSCGLALVSVIMLFTHMSALLEYTAPLTDYLGWFIPFFANLGYAFTPLLAFVYKKYIPALEENVRKIREAQD